MSLYQDSHRQLQDKFNSRKLADKLDQLIVHDVISPDEKRFIESREFFFLSTITDEGMPTVSFKGGNEGVVKVLDETHIVFPSYNGNGMFYSTGNISARPEVGLLFIDFEHPNRIRFHGKATVSDKKDLLTMYPEAELVVTVELTKMWVNCPRYIPKMVKSEDSKFVPKAGVKTPLADWKRLEVFQEVLTENERREVNAEGGPVKTGPA